MLSAELPPIDDADRGSTGESQTPRQSSLRHGWSSRDLRWSHRLALGRPGLAPLRPASAWTCPMLRQSDTTTVAPPTALPDVQPSSTMLRRPAVDRPLCRPPGEDML